MQCGVISFLFCVGCILPLVFIKTKPKHNISGTQLKPQSHNHAGHLITCSKEKQRILQATVYLGQEHNWAVLHVE